MPSDEPSRPYNWRPKSLAKLESKDISIISFDNNLFLDYLTPSITRVEQPIQEIGILATRTMIKYLKGREKIGASHNSVQLLPKLIIGDSVRNLRKQ